MEVLIVLALREIGLCAGDTFLFSAEVVSFSHFEKRVIGIAGFAIGEDDKGFIDGFEFCIISFRCDSLGEFAVCFANLLLGGSLLEIEHVVVVELVASDCSGELEDRASRACEELQVIS